ncbi:MAG: NAD-dependent epimerase/dehydratase family protein [Rubrobacteraceae bacterium]
MDVLIIGATGYVGSALSEMLVDAGYETAGLARSEDSAKKLGSMGLGVVTGDLSAPESFIPAVGEAEAVVYAAAPEGPDAAELDRGAVKAIIEELQGTGRTFVYTSGGWVVGSTNGMVADEKSPVHPPPGMEWRPAVEKLVLSAAKESGVRTFVVRPALVFGAGGGVVGELVDWAANYGVARYVDPPEEECFWTLIHREDLGRFYQRLIEGTSIPGGELLLAVGDGPFQTREIAAAAGRTAGVGGAAEAWPLEKAREELGTYADSLALSQKLSGSRAEALLGWKPTAPSVFEELEHGSYVKD